MNVRFTFKGMDHSDSLQNQAVLELEKVKKFLSWEPEPISFDIVFEAGRVHHHHKVEIRLNGKHLHLTVHEEGSECYEVLKHVVDKMIIEVKKHKDKFISLRNHPEGIDKDIFVNEED